MMDGDLVQKVSYLIMKDADFRLLSKREDVYCPFEALGAARTEIKHSNFLSNLITPNETHGFGDSFLKSILRALLTQADAPQLLLELHLSDLSNAIVMREWKHIDILIRLPRNSSKPDLIFAIEIKVEANEHGNQLEKYENAVNEAWPEATRFFFFLTPDHTQSSRHSWIDVSFSLLLEEFEHTLTSGEGHVEARRMAESYISMMRRRYVADEHLIDLAAQIWARHRVALEFLIENQPNAANVLRDSIEKEFLAKISQNTNNDGRRLNFILDSKSTRYLRFAVEEWDSAQFMLQSHGWGPSGRILLLEVVIKPSGANVRWVVGPGPEKIREDLIRSLDPNRQKTITNQWTIVQNSSLLNGRQMKAIIHDGLAPNVVSEVIRSLVTYAERTGTAFDSALRANGLLGGDAANPIA